MPTSSVKPNVRQARRQRDESGNVGYHDDARAACVLAMGLGALHARVVRYVLALGTWGFGGPVALVGYMCRDLVEKRRWISESDYKEGIALAQADHRLRPCLCRDGTAFG